ncbi:hypothetical protein [Rubinisphaera sp.]|uniref:hypothetical protein n=1 Tax=Rubinisphaera sp. TaxID=2024857 RepID=UPI000C0DE24D|nr:hypothetical protein [Rubinisphaera sp.]MBV08210.1 hypothetical protein [Rubinisphaera sp.]HCS54680.1 hypothetical protein [Planctomycetaceae bacterium]|tara:strand:- start:1298 stop:1855 length:558 start_codon:yes stop_codon:yes gene_type:complete
MNEVIVAAFITLTTAFGNTNSVELKIIFDGKPVECDSVWFRNKSQENKNFQLIYNGESYIPNEMDFIKSVSENDDIEATVWIDGTLYRIPKENFTFGQPLLGSVSSKDAKGVSVDKFPTNYVQRTQQSGYWKTVPVTNPWTGCCECVQVWVSCPPCPCEPYSVPQSTPMKQELLYGAVDQGIIFR